LSYNVRLMPSGHSFTVEANEPIIEAALREGLNLGHGCASGNCGGCKARLISGEVRRLRNQDFVFSETDKREGCILMCSNTPASNLVLETQEAVSATDIPYQEIRCTVRRVEHGSEGKMLLHLKTPRTQALRFLAGQRVSLTSRDGLSAVLPIASCPCDGRNLLFLLHDRPSDPFSRHAFEQAAASQALVLKGPQGGFFLSSEPDVPLLFVAFGLGVAPIKSMVEQALALDSAPSIELYRTRGGDGRGYLDRLFRSWKDALENFNYRPLAEQTPSATMAQQIAADLSGTAPRDLYVSGPAAILEEFREHAQSLGIALGQTHSDVVE